MVEDGVAVDCGAMSLKSNEIVCITNPIAVSARVRVRVRIGITIRLRVQVSFRARGKVRG